MKAKTEPIQVGVLGARPASGALKVLLVDDDESARRECRNHLARAGCEVTSARTAKEAAREALQRPYEVAIVEQCLPDARGTALVRWLRRRLPDLRVIMFTSHADWNVFFRATRCGASDVVCKSFSPREVLRVIRHWTHR